MVFANTVNILPTSSRMLLPSWHRVSVMSFRSSSRPERGQIVPALVGARELAGALCDVEDDGRRRPRELVGEVATAAREVLHDVVREDEEAKSSVVDGEAFVGEGHRKREEGWG